MFEPFYSTKGPGRGTGLGLAVIHGIVTAYGGAYRVTSRRGGGSEFAIYLPRADAASPEATSEDILGGAARSSPATSLLRVGNSRSADRCPG
ncbi:MAG: ATP-binding protein [Pseudomonadota bacterium]